MTHNAGGTQKPKTFSSFVFWFSIKLIEMNMLPFSIVGELNRSVAASYNVLIFWVHSVPGERAAGRAGAGQRHGPDPPRVQPPRPLGAEGLRPGQRRSAGQNTEGRQDGRGTAAQSLRLWKK